MALPSTGLITMSDIMTEYGKSGVVTLSDFYGTPEYPTTGLITLSNFYGKANAFTLSISTNTARPDIRALATSAGWNGVSPLVVNISAALINTLDLGTVVFANGITLNISASTRIGGVRGSPSSVGGYAFRTRVPVRINNLGTFSGGGGGGGYGCSAYVDYLSSTTTSSGGDGGYGEGFSSDSSLTIAGRSSGDSASTATYSGAVLGGDTRPWVRGGGGGYGGVWGTSGESGSSSYTSGGSYSRTGIAYSAANGRAPGPSVDGMAYITWVNQGTLIGPKI